MMQKCGANETFEGQQQLSESNNGRKLQGMKEIRVEEQDGETRVGGVEMGMLQ